MSNCFCIIRLIFANAYPQGSTDGTNDGSYMYNLSGTTCSQFFENFSSDRVSRLQCEKLGHSSELSVQKNNPSDHPFESSRWLICFHFANEGSRLRSLLPTLGSFPTYLALANQRTGSFQNILNQPIRYALINKKEFWGQNKIQCWSRAWKLKSREFWENNWKWQRSGVTCPSL